MRLAVILATILVATQSIDEDEYADDHAEHSKERRTAASSSSIHDKTQSPSELLKEVVGARRLKSNDGMYLRVSEFSRHWTATMSISKNCSEWVIEEHYGKVLLHAKCAPDYYLRTKDDYTVTMHGDEISHALWTPFKNEDGSWSFQGAHGTWLRASPDGIIDGIVSLQARNYRQIENEFWLESWIDAPRSANITPPTPLLPTIEHHESFDGDRSSEVDIHKQSELSREVAGPRRLRSAGLKYLTAVEEQSRGSKWTVIMSAPSTKCAEWIIEDHKGKVSLTSICVPGKFMRFHHPGLVDLADHRASLEMWTPFKNEDESWSFQNLYGAWLCVHTNGQISLESECRNGDRFWIESLTETGIPPHILFDLPSTTIVPNDHDEHDTDQGNSDTDRSSDAHNEKQIELSREVAGPRKLRTTVNKYLTAVDKGDNKWKVIMLAPSTKCAEWIVEDHNGKVALKPDCVPGKYMRSHHRGFVDLADDRDAHEMWTPFKNEDGSWSFQNHYGQWLCDNPHGRITLDADRKNREHFWLESWTVTTTTTSPPPTTTDIIPTSTTTIKMTPATFTPHGIIEATTFTTQSTSSSAEMNETAKSDVSYTAYSFFARAFIFSALLISLLAIVAKFYLVSHKRKPEIAVSYQNLVYEDLHP